MARQKPTERSLSTRKLELSRAREYRDRLDVLREGKDTPLWKALKGHLGVLIENATNRIDNILCAPTGNAEDDYPELKRQMGIKVTAREVIGQVDDSDEWISRAEDMILSLKERIKEAEEVLESTRED